MPGRKKTQSSGWGGARPGAGRKPKPPHVTTERDPLEFLIGVMTGEIGANAAQVKAAIAAAPYLHQKHGEGGKKDRAADAAKKAAGGKFAPAAPPENVITLRRPAAPESDKD